MVTEDEPESVNTEASIKIRLVIPLMETWITPESTIFWASFTCASVIPSRHSSPFPGSAAMAPSAAAYSFPTLSVPGIPQVKAFLYIPLLSRSVIFWIAPGACCFAVETARAMAPGSVTPRAGFMS